MWVQVIHLMCKHLYRLYTDDRITRVTFDAPIQYRVRGTSGKKIVHTMCRREVLETEGDTVC